MAKLVPGVNDLQTTHPELAAQAHGWDPTAVSKGVAEQLTWKCGLGHTWKASPNTRTTGGHGCPFCSGRRVLAGFNDLATTHPELAKEAVDWDARTVTKGVGDKLTWRCSLGHKYEATPNARTSSNAGCPYCSGQRVLAGFNDLATKSPSLAKEADGWDPREVAGKSKKKLLWKCSQGHTWLAKVSNRAKGTGCPVCTGKRVLKGENDLATQFPEVAKEAYGWDPSTVTAKSNKTVEWKCALNHTWRTAVHHRTGQDATGCPYCAGKKVLEGFNDLLSQFPKLAEEADGWDPSKVTAGSGRKFPWKCPKGHSYAATVNNRTPPLEQGCPVCAGKQVVVGFNDLASKLPEVAKQADGWDPRTVTVASSKKVSWRCELGHQWKSKVANRTVLDQGCPFCSGRKAWPGFNDLEKLFPEVAKEADGWDPRTVTAGTDAKLTWRCQKGHQWEAHVYNRTPPVSSGCPVCSGLQVLTGFNDLATLFPEVAHQADGWDPTKVVAGNDTKRSWVCSKGHRWKTTPYNRTRLNSGCPECAEFGFKTTKEAWFYLLERPGEQQLGVTNYRQDRLYTHSRTGWVEVEVVGPFPGDEVLRTEKELKQWLRREVGLVPGTHENWFTARLEVRSLAELKQKSGVQTELF